jgi:hypothetical protein
VTIALSSPALQGSLEESGAKLYDILVSYRDGEDEEIALRLFDRLKEARGIGPQQEKLTVYLHHASNPPGNQRQEGSMDRSTTTRPRRRRQVS